LLQNATHVVLDVWLAPAEEDHPARLVVPVLAAEVERGKPAAVLDVRVRLGLAQKLHRLAEPLPRRLVQSSVAVL
jgi:hypothetical protein